MNIEKMPMLKIWRLLNTSVLLDRRTKRSRRVPTSNPKNFATFAMNCLQFLAPPGEGKARRPRLGPASCEDESVSPATSNQRRFSRCRLQFLAGLDLAYFCVGNIFRQLVLDVLRITE